MQRSALCRSRRELSNAYFLAKFGFDTAENEPSQVCPIGRPASASAELERAQLAAGEEAAGEAEVRDLKPRAALKNPGSALANFFF